METGTFIYSGNFALGLHSGVDVKRGMEACLFRSSIDVIVVRVKVSRGTEPFFPMEIDSADTIVNRPMGR
jgi:hypothetical protein